MCVFVRDLIVYAVLTDMMRGRPAVYATFSSYSTRSPTTPGSCAPTRSRRCASSTSSSSAWDARGAMPLALSDHGQTQGATLWPRGAGRPLARPRGTWSRSPVVHSMVKHADGRDGRSVRPTQSSVSERDVVVLGSGNLGLVYLMELPRRLTLEEIEELHPALPCASTRTSAGCSSTPPSTAPSVSAAAAFATSTGYCVEGEDRGAVLPHRRAAPAAHGSLQQRRRHHGGRLRRRAREARRARRGSEISSSKAQPSSSIGS